MSWDELVGHRDVLTRFQSSVQRQRLGSSYLFVGADGIGKFWFAKKLAQALLCQNNSPEQLEICGECSACRQVVSDNHPDITVISRRPEKSVLTIDQFIGEADDRFGTGLCHDMMLKPAPGGRKIGIINDADFFHSESANAILKLLEEPPPRSLLILIGTSRQAQIRTILSRCQVIPFAPLSLQQVEQILQRLPAFDLPDGISHADLATASSGSVSQARWLAQADRFAFRRQWIKRLAGRDVWRDKGLDWISKWVVESSKDKQQQRDLLHWIAGLAIEFFRELLAHRNSHVLTTDPWLAANVARTISEWQGDDSLICDAIDRTIEFQHHIDANLSLPNSVEPWLSDLTKFAQGKFVVRQLN